MNVIPVVTNKMWMKNSVFSVEIGRISWLQVVANYYGNKKQYEPVAGQKIYWAGGVLEPPPDTPQCGFDGSGCPPEGCCCSSYQLNVYYTRVWLYLLDSGRNGVQRFGSGWKFTTHCPSIRNSTKGRQAEEISLQFVSTGSSSARAALG